MNALFVIKGDLKSFLLKHPVTNGFILICALIALTTIFLHGGYSSASIVDFSGLDKELIEEGQLWRLFTYGFGHMSLFHFLLNIPAVLFLAHPLEKYYGRKLFLVISIFLTVAAGISIYYFYEGPYPLAGSSGFGYGLMGIYAFYLTKHSSKLSSYDKKLISFILIIGIFSTFTVPNISISGHIGGLISGFALAFILYSLKKGLKTKQFYTVSAINN